MVRASTSPTRILKNVFSCGMAQFLKNVFPCWMAQVRDTVAALIRTGGAGPSGSVFFRTDLEGVQIVVG